MFIDLGVQWSSQRAAGLAEQALRHGWAAIAHGVTTTPSDSPSWVAASVPLSLPQLPSASAWRGGPLRGDLAAELGLREVCDSSLLQLRRLTIVVNGAASYSAAAKALQRGLDFDVVAVQPTSAEACLAACEKGDFELISLPLSEKLPFSIRRKEALVYMKQGGAFEVQFGPALRDVGKRRALFANLDQLVHITAGRGLLFCSGAADAMEMRSPADLANFAAVCGLRGSLALDSVSGVPHRTLQRAAMRRLGAVQVLPRLQPPDEGPAGARADAGEEVVDESGTPSGASPGGVRGRKRGRGERLP